MACSRATATCSYNSTPPNATLSGPGESLLLAQGEVPIDLAAVGHPAIIGFGPISGRAVETRLVIASTDALAADCVGAKILGCNPQAVRHLWEADKLGLGQSDHKKMSFPAMSLKEAVTAFTERAYGKRITFRLEWFAALRSPGSLCGSPSRRNRDPQGQDF